MTDHAQACDDAVTIELPFPPSTNHYYRHVELPLGKGGACPACGKRRSRVATLISSEGREWLKAVSNELFLEGVRPISGPLSVEIILHPPNRRKIDVDNRQKPLLDALKRRPKDETQKAWLFADDDSQVEKLVTEKGPIVPGGGCIVTVRRLAVSQQEFGFMEED